MCKNAAWGVVGDHNARTAPGCPSRSHRHAPDLVEHRVLELQVRAGERLGRALADRVDGAGRERDAEQVAREL